MDFLQTIPEWQLPFVLVGIGYWALAAWLLVLDFPSRLNRAFALYLFLDGASQFVRLFDRSTPVGSALWIEGVLMSAAAPFALLYFMLTYEERFGSRRWRAAALVPLLAAAGLLAVAILRDPALYFGASRGPLGDLTSWLHVVTPCAAAWLFGRQATRCVDDAPRRHALLIASFAFAAGPLFSALHLFVPGVMSASVADQAALAVGLVPLGLLVVHMARVGSGHEPTLRRESRRFLAWLSLPPATAILWSSVLFAPIGLVLWLMSLLMSAWMLALPLLMTYALVRHRLFDIDVKIRWGISRSTLAAAFVAAFFLASEGAQILLGQSNQWVGLLAAGALVFALAPLQRAAERLAERAVPLADAPLTAERAAQGVSGEDSYRQAVRLAMRDRRLTRGEEGHLHALARDLGIDAARAHTIIVEVEAEAAGGAPA